MMIKMWSPIVDYSCACSNYRDLIWLAKPIQIPETDFTIKQLQSGQHGDDVDDDDDDNSTTTSKLCPMKQHTFSIEFYNQKPINP